MSDEMQAAADELRAAYPDLDWCVSPAGRQVVAYDGERKRRAIVKVPAVGRRAAILSLEDEPWVSEHVEKNLCNAYGADGWGATAVAAVADAIAGLCGRWESAEVNKAWWVARLTEERNVLARELEDVVSALSALTKECVMSMWSDEDKAVLAGYEVEDVARPDGTTRYEVQVGAQRLASAVPTGAPWMPYNPEYRRAVRASLEGAILRAHYTMLGVCDAEG